LQISTAIVGLGKIGLTYDLDEFGVAKPNQVMTHCRSVSESNFFKISYLIDPQIESLKIAVHKYGGVGFHTSLEAVAQDSPQLLILSVPTSLHLETLLDITEKWKPTAYLIEKPFGRSSREARQMRDILKLQDAKVYVNYFRRYLPNFVLLKSSSKFRNRGRLNSVTVNGYGTLENVFSHFLDLLIFLESPSILGLSKKLNCSSGIEYLKFEDAASGVLFELNGVGRGIRECEMRLVYDSMVIEMTSNGCCLKIHDAKDGSIELFNLSTSMFGSYQAFVLKRIEDEFSLSQKNTSMEDAIRIHEFLESI
jgi:predicted dehydrogenase